MTTDADLVPAGTHPDLPTVPAADLDLAAGYARAEKAVATRRAYRTDFALFQAWCGTRGLGALPASPETVAAYLAAEATAGIKASTIGRRCASIRYAHKLADLDTPTDSEIVKATMRGIRRTIGVARKRKSPATNDIALAMVSLAPVGLVGLRDRALLLLGFAGAFRRSELVALDAADIEQTESGLRIHVRKSKTDQEGRGDVIAIVPGRLACPVAALKEWTSAAAIAEGPIFRSIAKGGRVGARLSDKSVANIVKEYAERLGLKPGDFAGHSLRSGFLTSAAARGASVFKMMDVSRHRSVDTLRGYVRDAEIFRDHAGTGLL